MTMTTRLIAAVSTVLAMATAGQSLAQTATDQRCAKGADVRRIEIRFADGSGGSPCKVIYRPEAESDTLGISSWRNIPDLAACEARADEIVERLTVEGWTCAEDPGESDESVGVAGLSDSPTDLEAQHDEILAEQSQSFDRAALPPDTPALAGEAQQDAGLEEDVPARFVDNPDVPPPSEELVAQIRDDLGTLDTTLDGLLEAKIAGYGDLNGDDVEDALVLYTYTSPQPAYRQFLAVYALDNGSYQLTATKPVGGSSNATMDARVEAIDQGVIHLTLQAFNPGDASCCPSGTQHLALALRDLDLVEIDATAPTR